MQEELSIDVLALSTRSANQLKRVGIFTIPQMLELTEEKLFQIRNLGKKSVEEIMEQVCMIRSKIAQGEDPKSMISGTAKQNEGATQEQYEQAVRSALQQVTVDALETLSPKAYNRLCMNQLETLDQLVGLTEEDIAGMPMMDEELAREVYEAAQRKMQEVGNSVPVPMVPVEEEAAPSEVEYSEEGWADFTQKHDVDLVNWGLSVRCQNALSRAGYRKLSQIICLTETQFYEIRNMGRNSVSEIMGRISQYKTEYANAVSCAEGDEIAEEIKPVSIEELKKQVIEIFNPAFSAGYNVKDVMQRLPEGIICTESDIKCAMGKLIAEKQLVYVDYRCYRVYPKFADFLKTVTSIAERSMEIVQKRLQGRTLEQIGTECGLTRERIRQIVLKTAQKVRKDLQLREKLSFFDEDYYQYLFETYALDLRMCSQWLGVSEETFHYLDMVCPKGKGNIERALTDPNIPPQLRLRIRGYLNRNKITLDGEFVEKKRYSLEDFLLPRLAKELISYDDFVLGYNQYLQDHGVEYDESIYIGQAESRSRMNRLADSHFVLWNWGSSLRYYDIDSKDYTELYETLNLEAYQDVTLSTSKFYNEFPEIMEKLDIRDQYELHNLLRKTYSEYTSAALRFSRMPMIDFGTPKMEEKILDMLIANAEKPIPVLEFSKMVCREYGYDPNTFIASPLYNKSVRPYFHQGMLRIDYKPMPLAKQECFMNALTQDFYYLNDLRKLYEGAVPDADPEEINPYTLHNLGFQVLSQYVIRNYNNASEYFTHLLTANDQTDLRPLRERYGRIVLFSQTLYDLQNAKRVIQYEPNKLVSMKRLSQNGITLDKIQGFCDAVWAFAEDSGCFTIQKINRMGFEHELYDYGFSEWFYGSLLAADVRFTSGVIFHNRLHCKGKAAISRKEFLLQMIREKQRVDIDDFIRELRDDYGMEIQDRSDILSHLSGTSVFYDDFLYKIYANEALYYAELGV